MDLVYILGSGSRWSDNEIRYSIRSAVKYFKFGKIFVIGERPDWMQNVEWVDAPDDQNTKIGNSINKQILAAKQTGLSKDYILMNDDFFFLKPMEELPVFHRGTTQETINNHKQKRGYYYEAMVRSQQKLEMMGLTGSRDYGVHCPIVMNKENFLSMIAVLGKEANRYLIRTCYGNIYRIGGEKIYDFKASDISQFNLQIRKNREFLSINDALVAVKEFREWIAKKFPEVSKYENDNGEGAFVAPGQSIKIRSYYATQKFLYEGVEFSKGQLLDAETVKKLRKSPKMSYLWELK